MTEYITCPQCRGQVGIPDNPPATIKCPKCSELVFSVDPETRATWKPDGPAPAWMNPFGATFTGIGAVAFIASFNSEYQLHHGSEILGPLVAGVANPLFFIGFPLGCYWLNRTGAFKDGPKRQDGPKGG